MMLRTVRQDRIDGPRIAWHQQADWRVGIDTDFQPLLTWTGMIMCPLSAAHAMTSDSPLPR